MKTQSLLNNAKTKIALSFLLIFIIFGVAPSLTSVENNSSKTVYHQSQWNEYAPEIDRAVRAEQSVQPLNLEHIYGGVASHHIPTTIPRLVDFYSRLKQTQSVKNFIVIGPDHTDAGKAPITVSNTSFFTAYGDVRPIDGLALKLQDAKLANIDEAPFDPEHSIGSQILIISKIFPGTKVTPIILRSDTTKYHAEALGKILATLVDDQTVLIASVDFSHYLSSDQAMPLDQISGEVVRNLDLEALPLVTADSSKSMLVFMEVMKGKKAIDTDDLTILNTNDLMQNSDYTTGYLFGFWGIRNKVSVKNDSKQTTTLLFVGDIMLSRSVGDKIKKSGDWRWPFLKISEYLNSADILFGNLEGPVSDRGENMGSAYSFRADPQVVKGLKYAGFDIVSVANNHMGDWGREAFENTMEILNDNNIDYVGGGYNKKEAYNFKMKEINGTKFAFLAYTTLSAGHILAGENTPGIALIDEDRLQRGVKEAREKFDVVIVSMHFGEEYQTKSNQYQQNIAHKAIDVGASLVIGHHPHVIQEIEKYKDGYIVYSLGNFIFDQYFSKETTEGLLLKVLFDEEKIESIEPIIINISKDYQAIIK